MANVTGTDGNDSILVGSASAGVVPSTGATEAADFIQALAGADFVRAGGGNDTIDAGGNNDTISGVGGNDLIRGEGGNDVLDGLADNDSIFGGSGNDIVRGGSGNDTVFGDVGDDSISGNGQSDTLVGGSGSDRFIFSFLSDSAAGARDTVQGVDGIGVPGGDIFSLSSIDANTSTVGNQAFNFIGETAFSAAGQLRVLNSGANTVIQGDDDGDRVADLEILVQDGAVVAADYTAGDFIL